MAHLSGADVFLDHQTASLRRIPLLALLAANAISLVGSRLTHLAIPLFVLATTGSATKTGLVAFVEALAAVVAGLAVSPVIDCLGPKRASVTADLASAVTVALIPLLHATVGLAFWQLLVLAFLRSLCDAPGGTARDALVPDVALMAGIPTERVNASVQVIRRAGGLVGFPLAGVLIATFGPTWVLWLDALSFLASAAIIAGTAPRPSTTAPRDRYLVQIAAGLRFVRRDRLLLAIVATVAITNFLEGPLFVVVLPVYVNHTLGNAVDLGLLLAGVGAGATVGALLYAAFGVRLPRRATFVGAFLLLGAPYWVLALLPPLAVSAGALVIAGIAAGPINPLIDTVKQERVPPELRGRVFGSISAAAFAATPLGMIAAGFLIEQIGVRATLLMIAAGFLAVTASMIVNPAFRALDLPPTRTISSGSSAQRG